MSTEREQDITLVGLDTILDGVGKLLFLSSGFSYRLDFGKREGPYERSLAEVQGILDKSPDKDAGLWYVVYDDEDGDGHTVAITGNGPKSEANAQFFAAAPQVIKYFMGQLIEMRDNAREAVMLLESGKADEAKSYVEKIAKAY